MSQENQCYSAMFTRGVAVSLLSLLLVPGAVLGIGESGNSRDCVTEQELAEELATVKEEMERKVDQLHSQLHYWQNITLNILKDHYSSLDIDDEDQFSVSTIKNISESNKGSLQKLIKKMDALEQHIKGTKQCCNDSLGSFCNPAHNCSHILSQHPGSPSDYYWLRNSSDHVMKVFCDMERVCGCDGGGGWMRVADLDMTQSNYKHCPQHFRKVITAGKTMCLSESRHCISVKFSTYGFQYHRVCGMIIGYMFGRPDGLYGYLNRRGSIETNFVDGFVLTHGSSPRNHIWTFIAGYNAYRTDPSVCPCNGYPYAGRVPPYIGSDYFCDSGWQSNSLPPFTYHTNDPLWDGAGCVSGSCCSFNSPPWFCKNLNLTTPTTDEIELRLCLDYGGNDEKLSFEEVELYIQ